MHCVEKSSTQGIRPEFEGHNSKLAYGPQNKKSGNASFATVSEVLRESNNLTSILW